MSILHATLILGILIFGALVLVNIGVFGVLIYLTILATVATVGWSPLP